MNIMKVLNVLPSARISYKLAKGSPAQRVAKSERFVKEFCNRTLNSVHRNKIKLKSIQELFDEILTGIKIIIAPNDDKEAFARSDFLLNSNNQLYGMTVDLTTSCKKIPRKDIIYLLHECRHIADNLYNPKYMIRFQRLEEKGLLNEKYYNIYENELYIRELIETKQDKKVVLQLLKRKIQKLLKNKSIDDKIDILQNMRYSLESEKNAFETQLKYAKEFNKKGIEVDEEVTYDYSDEFIFQDKIDLIKNMAFEIISTQRAKSAARLAKRKAKAALKLKRKQNIQN